MNHIRLLIRNQWGSHIIHGIPNPLAFQQNYSRYDGPSESGSFFTLSKPGLTSFLQYLYYVQFACMPWRGLYILSSAAKPGTHFLENNKIIGVFTMLKLCMSKERNM